MSFASSQENNHNRSASGGLQNLMAMALGSFRREDGGSGNSSPNNNNNSDDRIVMPSSRPNNNNSNQVTSQELHMIRTKMGAATKTHPEKQLPLNNLHPSQSTSHHRQHKQQQPPISNVGFRKNNSGLNGGETVTSEITMLNFDFDFEEEDNVTTSRNNNNDGGMERMNQAMSDMLNLVNGGGVSGSDTSGDGDGGEGLDLSDRKWGDMHSVGDISFGVSSIFNHKKRLNGNRKKNGGSNDGQRRMMSGGKIQHVPTVEVSSSSRQGADAEVTLNWHADSDGGGGKASVSNNNDTGVTPHRLLYTDPRSSGRGAGIGGGQQQQPSSLPPPPKAAAASTNNSTTASGSGKDQEQYTEQDIDAIILLKLEVANQRTAIDELSSKLNRTLSEKKELEEKLARLQQQQQGPSSSSDGTNVINSGLSRLSLSYKTASTIFSSLAAHKEETPAQSDLSEGSSSSRSQSPPQEHRHHQQQQQQELVSSQQQQTHVSPPSVASPLQEQQSQQMQTDEKETELKSQLLELQFTLGRHIESSRAAEQHWMRQMKQIQAENQRLMDENRQLRGNSGGGSYHHHHQPAHLGSSDLSVTSSGAVSVRRSLGGSINNPTPSSDYSSQRRIMEGILRNEKKMKQHSTSLPKRKVERQGSDTATECTTGNSEENLRKEVGVEPVVVRTKIEY